MALPTFRVSGLETIDGFKNVALTNCENMRVTFEIIGSTSFIRCAQSQLLLGSTTAKIDDQYVRLFAIQAGTDSDPHKVTILSRYEHTS